MRLNRIFGLLLAAVLAVAALCAQQNLSEDEVRLSSQPYTPKSPATLRVQANLVDVRVVVRDSKGEPVASLQQSDFQIFDNGKPQTISAFSVENSSRAAASVAAAESTPPAVAANPAPAPAKAALPRRYVALFFDDLNMPMGDLVPARKAAQDFISKNLEPNDRVGIFTSSTSVTLEFTSDTRKLLDSLAQIRPRLRRFDGGASCPRIIPYQAYLMVELHDQAAIDLAVAQGVARHCVPGGPATAGPAIVKNQATVILGLVDKYSQETMGVMKDVIQFLGKMSGRRTLLLASSGFLNMNTSLQRVQDNLVDVALRAGVVINSLDARGLAPDTMGVDPDAGPPVPLPQRPDFQSLAERLAVEQRTQMNEVLAFLALGTGGRFFHNNNDLGRGVRELAALLEVSYVLGFVPENLKPDRSYHNLKVTLAGERNFTLDARRGYFAPDKLKPAPPVPPEKFDAAVLAADAVAEIRVGITTRSEKTATGDSVLRVLLRVDTRDLPFLRRDDRSIENLRFVLALFDSQGKFLAGLEGEMAIALKDATLARISEQGLEQGLSLRAPPGAYRLRLVLQELMHGQIAAQSQPVEIR